MRTSIMNNIKVIILALILGVGASYVSAAWTNPPANPPEQNTPAPVNIGTITQTKLGALGVTELIANKVNSVALQITGGDQPIVGKVLTAIDNEGNAAWQTIGSTGGISPVYDYVFTRNGSWTVPSGVSQVLVTVIGGGGGGGGTYASGGGGASSCITGGGSPAISICADGGAGGGTSGYGRGGRGGRNGGNGEDGISNVECGVMAPGNYGRRCFGKGGATNGQGGINNQSSSVLPEGGNGGSNGDRGQEHGSIYSGRGGSPYGGGGGGTGYSSPSGNAYGFGGQPGLNGGFIQKVLSVSPGQTLNVTVGGGGGGAREIFLSSYDYTGYGGGGAAGAVTIVPIK